MWAGKTLRTLGLRVSGSDPTPLPWHRPFPETVPLIPESRSQNMSPSRPRAAAKELQRWHMLCDQTPPR